MTEPSTVRRTRLPNDEYKAWHDTGCNLHRSCLRCPLAVCQFDEPKDKGRPSRTGDAVALHAAGMPIHAIAAECGVTRRSVQRALAAGRAS